MSEYPFEIEADRVSRILTTTITGYWSLEVAKVYVEQARAATERMRAGGPFDMAVKIQTNRPLPRDASEYIEREQGRGRPADVRRMAYVCEGMLARLQVRRMTRGDPDMRVFADEASARAWLLAERAPAAAASPA